MVSQEGEPLDPRWEWAEVRLFGEPGPIYLKVQCRHLEAVTVDALDEPGIARLCLTCDQALYQGSASGP